MPKRVVDGDALWRSEKLRQVEPPSIRAEYANLIPLALANGSFEADPRLVWSVVYTYNRPDISVEMVELILDEFVRVKMLFTWRDAATGKRWGYWVGIDRPGRLPGKSRHGTNERIGALPPEGELRKFLDSNCFHPEESRIRELPAGSEKLLGYGYGTGEGSGNGKGKSSAHSENERAVDLLVVASGNVGPITGVVPPNENRLAAVRRSELIATLYNKYPRKIAKADAYPAIDKAVVAVAKAGPTDLHAAFNGDEAAAAQWLEGRVDLYARSPQAQQLDKSKVPYPATWFNGARYDDDASEWNHVGVTNGSRRTSVGVPRQSAAVELKRQLEHG